MTVDDAPETAGASGNDAAERAGVRLVAADPVLQGAVDMHVHGYPDVGLGWQMRIDDLSMVRLARDSGLAGIVLKSHFWPTMDRALILNERLGDPDFRVHGSITLNHLVGGVSPMAVEAAALHGARVVFMPTWGSRNDHGHGGVVRREVIDRVLPTFGPRLETGALTIVDGDGRLQSEAREVLAVAKEYSMVVSTAHVSVTESLAIAAEAAEIGLDRLIFGHPFSRSVQADMGVMREMADRGALVEMTHTHTVMLDPPARIVDIHEAIVELGAERVLLCTDVFFPWQPPQAESFRMFVGQLRDQGCSDEELRTMVVDNPARLLAT
jgi:hypothetical protein